MNRRKWLFLANRCLIVLAVAAILVGLHFNEWRVVLYNASILCLSCMGLGK